jgi:AcrR family transcriptional regulator
LPHGNLDVVIDNSGRSRDIVSVNIEESAALAYHHGNLREALLARAAEVIAQCGVDAVSLRGLARDLGVSHAAPSRHFADRAALLAELARDGFRRSVEAMNAGAQAAGSDPVARYRALGRSYVRFACDNPAYFRAINHPEVRARADADLLAAQREWFATLRKGVEAARAAGWNPDADPDALVAFSVAAAMGAAALFADAGWRALLAADDVDALADAVLDLVVHRSRTTALPSPGHPDSPTNDRRVS